METADSTPLVSVIIPIYNAAEFLRETLDSVCAQTLREIEIICVDDGSTDGTPAILAEYAARDPRFVLLRQQNKFAGAARNHGMSVARGKYISFLDSDDLFAPEMFECMVATAEKWQADMVHCMGCEYFPETGQSIPMPNLIAPELLERYTTPICLRRELGNRIFLCIAPATWNKLYLASFIQKHRLDWPTTLYGEDMGFALVACYLAERTVLLSDLFIHYRIRSASISHSKNQDVEIYFRAYQILHERLIAYGAEEPAMQSFANRMWQSFLNWIIPNSSPSMLEKMRITYAVYDTMYFHILERSGDYFYNRNTYEQMRGFFLPSISFVIIDTPAWCVERKLESLSGMPFYDYEILFATDSSDAEVTQMLEAQAMKNPRLRIVRYSDRCAETACKRAARGRICIHLPGTLKLRAGVAPALRELAKSATCGRVPEMPYCVRQTRHEFLYRCRSNKQSWCLFGKPVFSIYYPANGGRRYFILGRSVNGKKN